MSSSDAVSQLLKQLQPSSTSLSLAQILDATPQLQSLHEPFLQALSQYRRSDPITFTQLFPTIPMINSMQKLSPATYQQYKHMFATNHVRGLLDKQTQNVAAFYAISKSSGPDATDINVFVTDPSLDKSDYTIRLFADALRTYPAVYTTMNTHRALTFQLAQAFPDVFFDKREHNEFLREDTAILSIPHHHTLRIDHAKLESILAVYLDKLTTSRDFARLSRSDNEMNFTSSPTHQTLHNGWATWSFLGLLHDIHTKEGSMRYFYNPIDSSFVSTKSTTTNTIVRISTSKTDVAISQDKTLAESFKHLQINTVPSKAAKKPFAMPTWASKTNVLYASRDLYFRRWLVTDERAPGPVRDHPALEKRVKRLGQVVTMPAGIVELIAHGIQNCPVTNADSKDVSEVYFSESDFERVEPLMSTQDAVPLPLVGEYNKYWYMLDGGHRFTAMALRDSTVRFMLVPLDMQSTIISSKVVKNMSYPKLFIVDRKLNEKLTASEVFSNYADERILPSFAAKYESSLAQMQLKHSYFDREEKVVEVLRLPSVDGEQKGFISNLTEPIRVMNDSDGVDWEKLKTHLNMTNLAGTTGRSWKKEAVIKVEFVPGQQLSTVDTEDFEAMHDGDFSDNLKLYETNVEINEKKYACEIDVGSWSVNSEDRVVCVGKMPEIVANELLKNKTGVMSHGLLQVENAKFANRIVTATFKISGQSKIVIGNDVLAQLNSPIYISSKGMSLLKN